MAHGVTFQSGTNLFQRVSGVVITVRLIRRKRFEDDVVEAVFGDTLIGQRKRRKISSLTELTVVIHVY